MPTLEIRELIHRVAGPFNFVIVGGECIGLQGPSGSGKTLLLRAIADLDPHEGDVLLGGSSADSFSPSRWRTQVGYLPAESAWWFETVGPHFPDMDASAVRPALHALGFEPDVLDWEVGRLSTGEKQRLALARLLARRPAALLLDEPTAALDADNISRVESLVSGYRETNDAPVLWVSHDTDQLDRVAESSFVLKSGRMEPIEAREVPQ